jgi:hypothetical protein
VAIAGVVVTAALTGAATRTAGKHARGPAAPARAALDSCTLVVTTAVAAGHMTVCVDYAYERGGDVQLHAVKASYQSQGGYIDPSFSFVFRNARTGLADDRFSSNIEEANAVRADSTGWIAPAAAGNRKAYFQRSRGLFQGNEELIVTLVVLSDQNLFTGVAGIEIGLTRPGFPCPAVGVTNDGIPVC